MVPPILRHSSLGVALTALCIEWLTQRHYVESVKDANEFDPLFASMLRHHWLEEAQHAKLDTLIIDKIASPLSPSEIEKGVDDFTAIGKMLDSALAQQVQFDVACLSKAVGRNFTDAEKQDIVAKEVKAYRWTFLLSGITHPNFDKSLRELTAAGHARVAELARAIA